MDGINKSKRNVIEIEQKREICLYYQQHPTLKHRELIQHFNLKFNMNIRKSTMFDILRDSHKWLNYSSHHNSKRVREPRYPALEQRLYNWYIEQRTCMGRLNITDDELLEKAKFYGEILAINDFKYSNGWLDKFKKRYLLQHKKKAALFQVKPHSDDETSKQTSSSINTIINNQYTLDDAESAISCLFDFFEHHNLRDEIEHLEIIAERVNYLKNVDN